MNYDNRTVPVGAAELGYRTEGEGDRKILLLHGLNSHSGTWRKTFPAFASRYSVFAPSLPPHIGEVSAALVEEYSGYVGEMSRKLGITDATVIGNSMGGWIGMRLASLHAGIVSRLVLEDTAGSRSEDAKALEDAGIPTLIIWGEADDILPVSEARGLHSRLAGSQLKVVHGAGHVPHWEEPDVFNGLVTDFLQRG
ncbi:MAG: alpha/beta hydrolase [Thaumarchaeota archaeon]|nr:alpha/beta hydrolase [Nitrososphaerota archaeon]